MVTSSAKASLCRKFSEGYCMKLRIKDFLEVDLVIELV